MIGGENTEREQSAKGGDPSQRLDDAKKPEWIGGTVVVGQGASTTVILNELAESDPGDVQQIAASEIRLLTSYYDAVLAQATLSFRWALVAAGIGLVFFLGALVFLLVAQASLIATISVIGGAMVEVIAGINFVLYGRTTAQLAEFHQRLDRTQRFLLANSICESLNGETKERTRAALVHTIATTAISTTTEEIQ